MSDILEQNEIDSLLSALSSGEVDMEEMKEESVNEIKKYDFFRPDKLSKEQMRTLEMIHENLSRLLTTILSTKLRSMVNFSIATIEQLSYEEFVRSLPEKTIIGIAELKPLEGQFLFEIDPDIGFTIIERLFGGLGNYSEKRRSFTDIERVVLKKVLGWFLSGIPGAWDNIIELKPQLLEIESNPQFTQIVPGNDMTIIVSLATEIADNDGLINICIPYIMLEPIVDRLNAQQWFAKTRKEQTARHIKKIKNRIEKATLNLYAELGQTQLTVEELLFLEKGDVIKLDKKAREKIKVKVENKSKYKAIAGISNRHKAVKILGVISDYGEGEVDE